MAWCDRGVQTLLATVGAFAAFSLMTVAIGTDYWLYSRAYICNVTNVTTDDAQQPKKARGDLTHSGLWRICCIEGINQGSCYRINHFPDDNDYDTDSSEYLLRIVRASSVFPILSTVLLLLGGACVAVGRIYSKRNNILLSAGILLVAAGLSNIIGIIVYISSNAGDPSDRARDGGDRRHPYAYGWSFYSGALSFIVAEAVAVLAVNLYIERNKELRWRARRRDLLVRSLSSSSPYARMPSFRYRRRASRSSSRSSDSDGGGGGGRENSPAVGLKGAPIPPPHPEMSMYTLTRDGALKAAAVAAGEDGYSPEREAAAAAVDFLQVHNCFPNDLKDGVNRRTTPV